MSRKDKQRKWPNGLLLVVLLLMAVLIGEHIIHRATHDGAPTFVQLANKSGNDQSPLTVSFPGLRTDGEIITRPFHDFRQQQGGALLVQFDPYYFNRQETIEATYDELIRLGRTRIILNLTSMGGRVGTDFIDYTREQGSRIEIVAVILKDTPMIGTDVQGKEAWQGLIASLIPGGNLTNGIYKGLKGNEQPPPLEQLEPNLDQGNLEAHWQAMNDWPFSGITSEARSIYWRIELEPNKYKGIPLIIIRSSHDTLISFDNQFWLEVFGRGVVIKAESPDTEVMHVGFTEAPAAWIAAEIKAYGQLPA